MDKNKIKKITAREILDSRGNPTVEARVELENGTVAKASAPSGASTGEHEALELRDGDKKRYSGLGVTKAVSAVDKISVKLSGIEVSKQQEIDEIMIKLDGTKDKSKLGANAILAVSLACARAASLSANTPLYKYLSDTYKTKANPKKIPTPMFNVFNGGRHADTNLDVQELMIVPVGIKGFSKQLQAGAEIFHALAEVLKDHHLDTDVGNEGGYAPNIDSTIQAIELILTAISKAGYHPGKEIALATDIGASELYDVQKRLYTFDLDDHFMLSDQLISLYRDWAQKYPFFSIEDGLAQDDWESWEILVKEFSRFKPLAQGQKMLLVGDDLVVTNTERLKSAIDRKACNAVILKPNQIGTLTESMEFAKLAKDNDIKIITSHRSGETTDDFIADLAVSIDSEFVKFGSLSRGERVVKYNRLLEIEDK